MINYILQQDLQYNKTRKMSQAPELRSKYYQYQQNLFCLPRRFSCEVRKKMFDTLMKVANPTSKMRVLDVGVTCDQREDSNFFEKMYPYPRMITATGIEDCSFLEKDFPGLKFLKTDAMCLPFKDKSFDLVVSFATIEHVGSRKRQQAFMHELCRVGHQCCITTPNRWYPLEFHTITPFIHWFSPQVFHFILRCIGKSFLAKEENLNLILQKDILRMLPKHKEVYIKHFRLFGLVSNLMFYIKDYEKT